MKYLIALIILTCGAQALAETLPVSETIDDSFILDLKGIKSQAIPVNGVSGVWFNATDADKILQVLQVKVPHALALIKDQDLKLVTLQFAIDHYKLANDSLSSLADNCNSTIDKVMKMKVPSETTPFYKEPHFVFISGIVVGASLTMGIVYASTNIVKRVQ